METNRLYAEFSDEYQLSVILVSICFTIFKGELVFCSSGYMPGNGITGSTLDSFHFLFVFIMAHASGYEVVEKLFLRMKILVATVKDLRFLRFLRIRTAFRER